MFKPWSIISITAAVAIALVLWVAMIRFEIRPGRDDRDRGRHARLLPPPAVRRDHHRPVAAGVRAGMVGPAGRAAGAGRPSSASGLPRRHRAVLPLLVRVRRLHVALMALLVAATRRSWAPLLPLVGHRASSPRRSGSSGGARGWRRRGQGFTRRLRHRAALPAHRRSPTDLPDAELHTAGRAVHGRDAVAGGPGAHVRRGRSVGGGGPRRLRVVTAVDGDDPGGNHAAVVPVATDTRRAAQRRRAFGLSRPPGNRRRFSTQTRRIVARRPRSAPSAR